MKIFMSLAVLVAAVVAKVVADDAAAVKQLYHVTLPKAVFDSALASFGDDLDVWEVKTADDDKTTVKADIYTTQDVINKFYTAKPKYHLLDDTVPSAVTVERDPVDTAALIQQEASTLATCTTATRRHLQAISATKYIDNAFFDCWRTADEVYAFLDTLVTENPTTFSKIASVATSIEGRTIPAYKIATGGAGKKAIYIQGLIHAREWHAGSTTFYAIAALLDGLRNGDAAITSILNQYDWYFVPIVNIDGFRFTFSNTRLWRKNRRKVSGSTYGVDLNRNFGPQAYFGKAGDGPSSETYPGTAPLSEPETAGIFKFLKTLPLAGAIDIHSYSNLVLRPYGIQYAEAAAPYGAKLKTLGDNVKTAVQANSTVKYTSQTAAALYLCYGTVLDSIFLEFNKTASLSFEMEGSSFVVDKAQIRPGGQHVFQGIVQFAKELPAYYS
uniref:Peptidase M14 domain-containing protein n=1 Tax=Globisporangium ultimum (strain ATCC 200006 / CBS 805.95 / DAOM BR144) TaxID=431595 RepID=K3X7Q5_GLOUD